MWRWGKKKTAPQAKRQKPPFHFFQYVCFFDFFPCWGVGPWKQESSPVAHVGRAPWLCHLHPVDTRLASRLEDDLNLEFRKLVNNICKPVCLFVLTFGANIKKCRDRQTDLFIVWLQSEDMGHRSRSPFAQVVLTNWSSSTSPPKRVSSHFFYTALRNMQMLSPSSHYQGKRGDDDDDHDGRDNCINGDDYNLQPIPGTSII